VAGVATPQQLTHLTLGGLPVALWIADATTPPAVPPGLYYRHLDHLGGLHVLTDAAGVVKKRLTYYPFGEPRPSTATGELEFDRHRFTGQELDSTTQLYDYGARYYNPALGRFLSPDSIVPDSRNPQSLNRYSYVRNNPLSRIDPTGHEDLEGGVGWWEAQPTENACFAPWAGGTPSDFTMGGGQISFPSQLASDWPSISRAAAGNPGNPGNPVPVVLDDGTIVQNPRTGGPLLQPAGVSLNTNAAIGQVLRYLPTFFSTPPGPPIRESAMTALFAPWRSMDYQRIYGTGGLINRDFVDFGNYNYGIVSAAAGYKLADALFAAGIANFVIHGGDRSGPFFNNPRNMIFIGLGYNDFTTGRIAPR
jgi:RHS repeat-associated protein